MAVEPRCSLSPTGLGVTRSTGHEPQHHSENGILAAEGTARMGKPAMKTRDQATASNCYFNSSNYGTLRNKGSVAHPRVELLRKP